KSNASEKAATNTLLSLHGVGRAGSLEPIDLTLAQGEVVGLAGLLGSGRTELCRLVFGVDKKHSGTFTFNGQDIDLRSPRQAMNLGIGLCPEDRKHDGIL